MSILMTTAMIINTATSMGTIMAIPTPISPTPTPITLTARSA